MKEIDSPGYWLDLLTNSKGEDFAKNLLLCIKYYEDEYEKGRKETLIYGSLEKQSITLPQIVETRFSQLQEIESILELLNIKLKQIRALCFRKFLEKYPKQLSSREAEKFVDGEKDVVEMSILINRFSLVRNLFLSLHKALETKVFQINNVTKLRVAGLEDVYIKSPKLARLEKEEEINNE